MARTPLYFTGVTALTFIHDLTAEGELHTGAAWNLSSRIRDSHTHEAPIKQYLFSLAAHISESGDILIFCRNRVLRHILLCLHPPRAPFT